MIMEDFFVAITNFGFPIVVASYLLFRFEKKIESLDNNITELSNEIKRLCERIDGRTK